MKKALFIVILLVPTLATAQLQWRISIKVFTNANGALPQLPNWGLGGATLFQELSNGVNFANNVLSNSARGYSWQLTEIVTVAGTTTPLPASTNSWFNLSVNAATQDDLDTQAKGNPSGFQFRSDAINFYYVNGNLGVNGGYCAFPTENQHVITIAPNSAADVLIHESGHFFNLQHTHNTQAYKNADGSTCTNANPCTCSQLLGGNDDSAITDTPLDNTCWSQDQVAQNQYGQLYALLNSSQQFFVDNTWSNIMSYHAPGNRFTDDQLDVIADNSNGVRFNVATGRTRFVDANTGFGQLATSTAPVRNVVDGINVAIDGDIVLIRPGNYNEPGTYTKPVTLRATRGAVTIGVP